MSKKKHEQWIPAKYCYNHKNPMLFKPCNVVIRYDENGNPNAKGKFTKSTCSLKRKHPQHLHCSARNCTKVSNMKHPSYTKEYKVLYPLFNDRKMQKDLMTAKKAQEKREE